ncbi:MAG: hypothetical protein B7X48_12115, partial [Acidiphilium sp. 34-60-192]
MTVARRVRNSEINCRDNAFLAFGGVPVEALLDNMKTVVIEWNVYGQGLHRFHPAFLDYPKSGSWISYGPERRLDFQRLVVAQPGLNRSG